MSFGHREPLLSIVQLHADRKARRFLGGFSKSERTRDFANGCVLIGARKADRGGRSTRLLSYGQDGEDRKEAKDRGVSKFRQQE